MSKTRSSMPKMNGDPEVETEAASPGTDEGEQAIQLWESLYEIPFDCPSGAHVILTPPTLVTFIRARRMPQELAQLVDKKVDKKKGKQPATPNVITVEGAQEGRLYAMRICESVMLRPKCVAPDDDGNMRELKPGEADARRIPELDLYAIANWATAYNKRHGVGGNNGKVVTSADAMTFRDNTGLSTDGAGVPGIQVESGGATADQ